MEKEIVSNKKQKAKKTAHILQTAIALVLSFAALFSVVFSWYALSLDNDAKGISLSANGAQIDIDEFIYIERGFEGNKTTIYFQRDGDGVYYESAYNAAKGKWEFVLDGDQNKKPFSIKGLWPGESVDFYIPLNKTDAANADFSVDLRFENLTGDMFACGEGYSSVLTVYRVNLFDQNGAMGENIWLDNYANAGDDPQITGGGEFFSLKSFIIISGKEWNDEESQLTLHFRLTFDTKQIDGVNGVKELSEKAFKIGRIVITAVNK